ncbi:MAG: PQQ-binding-like beta-propeller repeat protein, partial [Euryarchaeota archaeon]|nr:PQQ-binding-like beta-propeller repeat protein [Euryarchaeota archaeon]
MDTLKGLRGTAAALLLVLSLGAVPAWGAAAGSPSPVELWKYSTFGSINDIALSPNATLITGVGGDGRLYLLNNASKLLGAALLGPEMFRVAMSPDGGTMAVVERSPEIRAHGADLREAWRFRARSIATAVAAFSGGFAVGDDGGRVTFLDGAGAYRAEAVTAGPIRGLAATPGGERVAALSGDGNLYLLDGRGRMVRKFPTEDAQALGLSPEGDMLAVGTKAGVLRVLNADGDLQWEYRTPGPVVRAAASRGGRLVVAATSTQIVSLDGLGNFLWRYEDPIGILSVAVSEDGSRVAYGGKDTYIHWLSSGLATLEPPPAASPTPTPVQSPSPTLAATPSPPPPSPT